MFVLLQGDRGLYTTDGNKIYFPDRKWSDAKVGLYDNMHVTVDKGNYAFITGKPVETQPITIEDIVDDFNAISCSIGKLEDTDCLLHNDGGRIELYFKIDGSLVEVESVYYSVLHRSTIRPLYDCASRLVELDEYVDYFLSKHVKEDNLSEQELRLNCARVSSSYGVHSNVEAYRNGLYRVCDDLFYIEDGRAVCVPFSSSTLSKYTDEITPFVFTPKDMREFCLEHKIALMGYPTDTGLYMVKMWLNGDSHVDVYCNCLKNYSFEHNEIVESSWKRYKEFLSRMAKSCSKESRYLVQKFSPLRVLGF